MAGEVLAILIGPSWRIDRAKRGDVSERNRARMGEKSAQVILEG